MKIQQTYIFIFLTFIFISIFASIALIWSALMSSDFVPFAVLLIISIFFLVSIYISLRNINLNFDKSSCLISIFISWLIIILMGFIPFYIMFPDEKIGNLVFLTISLVTTFGSWVELPFIINQQFLIWKSLLQWLGGLSTILIASFLVESILTKKKFNVEIFNLDNLKIISLFYILVTIIFALVFYLYEFYSLDEALRLSMSLVSTSNSFNENGSIIIDQSFSFKLFMILAMIFGSISVSLHYKSFNYGIKYYFRNTNFYSVIIFLLFLVLILSLYISSFTKIPVLSLFIDTLFLLISFVSTTGLIPESLFNQGLLNNLLLFLLIFSLIGGAVNSTTGGLKVSRLIFIAKFIRRELYKLANPRIILSKESISQNDNTFRIFIFCILFLFAILVLGLFLSLSGLSFESSIIVIVSSITNSGLGLIQISDISYYPVSIFEKIIVSIALLFGRIEVFLIMLFSSNYFWKHK